MLTDPEFDPDAEVCVRVRPVGAGAADDLDGVLADEGSLDSLMVPKVGDRADVDAFADLLAARDAALPVFALVESARGVLHSAAIADADRVDALCFGAEDLAADVGA